MRTDAETILVTSYGKPFSEKSLTGRMADWTRAAGLEPGCILHDLRKTLGQRMADAGATSRQAMAILGHDDIEHAELYSREADSLLLSVDAKEKVVNLFARG
ncbi:site-specific tyrosine recombinase XerC [Hartmannibacter diazotrophicus]|uniref:Site-specific tyrosine recombinase XerC n=1 Tax=Hartmannibacter diazotrophicus TaxID=1482074 RepID=A0A2C9D2K5_9HYPH|nr:site-specific tyrosine recombinase XerC [Hartmannibacter diazotrophicus]